MPQILVRNLESEVIDALKRQARANGRSLEAEVREILRRAATGNVEEFRRKAATFRATLQGRTMTDSLSLLREDREP